MRWIAGAARAGDDPAADDARSPAADDLRGGSARPGRRPRRRHPSLLRSRVRARVPAAVAAGRLDGALAPGTAPGASGARCSRSARPVVAGAACVGHAPLRLRRRRTRARSPRLVRRYPARRRRCATQRARGGAPGCRRSRSGAGRPWLSRELQWDAYTRPLGCHLRGLPRAPHHLPGRLLPVRARLPGRVPRSAPAHAADDLRRPVAGSRRPALLGRRSSHASRARSRTRCPSCASPFKFGNVRRPRPLAAPVRRRVRARDAGPRACSTTRVRFAGGGSGDACGLTSSWPSAISSRCWGRTAATSRSTPATGRTCRPTSCSMTESTLVDAQAAYIYPRLALLARRPGRPRVRARSSGAPRPARPARRPGGSGPRAAGTPRGYAGDARDRHRRDLRRAATVGDPRRRARPHAGTDAWSPTSGASSRAIGAPAAVHGPARIGSSQSPAANDPARHRAQPPAPGATRRQCGGVPGGSWYAINGWLTWALGTLGGTVPHARHYAFSEFERNTLTAHATAFPVHWDGILSVDDVCHSFYSPTPPSAAPGSPPLTRADHAPAGVESVRCASGWPGSTRSRAAIRSGPSCRSTIFSLAFPDVAVAYRGASARLSGQGRPWSADHAGGPARRIRHRRPVRCRAVARVCRRSGGAGDVGPGDGGLPSGGGAGRAASWEIVRVG